MKAKKLASGKYSITDISAGEFADIIAGLSEMRKRFYNAEVPATGRNQIRAKMDATANRYDGHVRLLCEADAR
jgi:hypothetical protein